MLRTPNPPVIPSLIGYKRRKKTKEALKGMALGRRRDSQQKCQGELSIDCDVIARHVTFHSTESFASAVKAAHQQMNSPSRQPLPTSQIRRPSLQVVKEEPVSDFWERAAYDLKYIDSVDNLEESDSDDAMPTKARRKKKTFFQYEGGAKGEKAKIEMECVTSHWLEDSVPLCARPTSGVSHCSTASIWKFTGKLKSWSEGETNERRRQSALKQNLINAKLEVEQAFLLLGSYKELHDLRYYFQHPTSRLFVCHLVILCNFLMFAEDPVSHSRAESDIPFMGNVFSFVMTRYPPQWTWATVKVLMWILAILCGLIFGKAIVHAFISRVLRLKMFREDQGSWMTMFLTVLVSLYFFSHIYNLILYLCNVDSLYLIDSRMYISNASVMKATACATWLGDQITALMVTDMMLQDTLYPDWAPWLRHKWRSSNAPRILLFWVGSAAATVVVLFIIISDWISWDQLNHDMVATTELSRAFLASFILVMDLLIVIQDWDFPHFTTTHHVNLPGLRVATLRFNFAKVRVTGKWFNYGIIFCVMIFDLNMWKNQIFYDPANYGQYAGDENKIHSVIDKKVLLTGNATLWSRQARMLIDPRSGKPYHFKDRVMNSRYLGYPLIIKCTAVAPSILGVILFTTLIALYGRFPIASTSKTQTDEGCGSSIVTESDNNGQLNT